MKSKIITLQLTTEELDRLDSYCMANAANRSALIRKAISEYLSSKESSEL